MLDNYIEEQPIVYKVLKNSILKNKLSHAYLFELNDYSKGYDLAISFAKFLLCPNNYSNKDNCGDCSICDNIDNNNHIEFKVIEPDGQWIKKEQLNELQREFMKKSLSGDRKVYIINQAEKLNVSASNSLLKFLEEPPEGIVAILVTNNMYQLLNTIISRCQIISFKRNVINNNLSSNECLNLYLGLNDNELIIKYIDEVIEFINSVETKGYEAIIYKCKDFTTCFNDRNLIKVAFDMIVLYYKDVLNYKLNIKLDYFNDYIDSIKKIASKNEVIDISNKIKIIVDLSSKIKFNLNANLLVDRLVIMLSEV